MNKRLGFFLTLVIGLFIFAGHSAFSQDAPCLKNVQKNQLSRPEQLQDCHPGICETYPEKVKSGGFLPLGLGIVPPLQLPGETWDIYGLRLNLFVGRNNNVNFFDIGTLGNITLGNMNGLAVAGIWNQVSLKMQGLQIAAIGNGVKGDVTGLQIAAFVNHNSSWEKTRGCQISGVNLAGEMEGVQIGLFNRAEDLSGLQIGIINRAENLSGLQIGLVNIIRQSQVPWMLGLNFGF